MFHSRWCGVIEHVRMNEVSSQTSIKHQVVFKVFFHFHLKVYRRWRREEKAFLSISDWVLLQTFSKKPKYLVGQSTSLSITHLAHVSCCMLYSKLLLFAVITAAQLE